MIFGEDMPDPIQIKSNVTLDIKDDVTISMIQNIIGQAMQAIGIGRAVFASGKPVSYLVQAIDPNTYTDMIFENKN